MTTLELNSRCQNTCENGARENRPRDASGLERAARELVEREISFIYRPNKDRSDHPPIDDLDAFFAELDRAESAEASAGRSGGRAFLPLPDRLLTPEQERLLFVQMNYLKCRANALRSRLDPERPSRRRIREIQAHLADAGRIRDRLCECNLRLVISLARKLSNSHNQFEDFVSEGFPILMRCIDLFDASRGFRFSTYVTHAVQRHLYRALQKSQRRRKRQPSTDAEVLENVAEAECRAGADVDHAAICESIRRAAEADLDDREALILKRRFGLDGARAQTLRQLAADLGISKERVRQLQLRALEKLQEVAASLGVRYEFE